MGVLNQAIDAVLVGTALSFGLSLPWLVWQFRRFGTPSPSRLLWYVVTVVYASAVVAYTLFPLPDLDHGFCTGRGRPIVTDPTEYFRAMAAQFRGKPLPLVLTSWAMLQMVFNVLLFVPLGVIARRFLGWSAPATIAAGLGISVLVEATQYTANWFLMPCSYRLADVNDLLTNTTGAAIGVLLARAVPRFAARPEYLEARRHLARPVTRGRRLLGVVLDAWYLFLVGLLAVVLTLGVALALTYDTPMLSNAQWQRITIAYGVVAWLFGVILVVVPAATSNGASLGQRTVYLEPVPRSGGRRRQVARALSVQGLLVTGLLVAPAGLAVIAVLWALADVAAIARDPRGLSFLVTDCDLRDSRVPEAHRSG